MKPNPYLIDDENPEWTKEDFRKAIPARQFYSESELKAIKEAQVRLGEKLRLEESQKQRISLSLDKEIIMRFKATGKGWQGRINESLKTALN